MLISIRCVRKDAVFSPVIAARATFALKAGAVVLP